MKESVHKSKKLFAKIYEEIESNGFVELEFGAILKPDKYSPKVSEILAEIEKFEAKANSLEQRELTFGEVLSFLRYYVTFFPTIHGNVAKLSKPTSFGDSSSWYHLSNPIVPIEFSLAEEVDINEMTDYAVFGFGIVQILEKPMRADGFNYCVKEGILHDFLHAETIASETARRANLKARYLSRTSLENYYIRILKNIRSYKSLKEKIRTMRNLPLKAAIEIWLFHATHEQGYIFINEIDWKSHAQKFLETLTDQILDPYFLGGARENIGPHRLEIQQNLNWGAAWLHRFAQE